MLMKLTKLSELHACDVLMKRKRPLARIAGHRWLWCSVCLETKMTNTDLHERIPKSSKSVCMMIVNRKKTLESFLSFLTPEEKCLVVILSLTKNETLKNPKTIPYQASSVLPKIGNLFSSLLLTTCLLFHYNMIWCSLSELIIVILPFFLL